MLKARPLVREIKPLRQAIRSYWEQGFNTADMAKFMNLPEHTIERQLHIVLEQRHAVLRSLAK